MNGDRLSSPGRTPQQRMQLRYGFNEIYGWWHLSAGPHREEVQRRLRLMNTSVVRVFVFDQPVPDPVKNWSAFAGHLQSILDIGARPMVTFEFHVNPLVPWIWMGGIIMAFGTLVAMWPTGPAGAGTTVVPRPSVGRARRESELVEV